LDSTNLIDILGSICQILAPIVTETAINIGTAAILVPVGRVTPMEFERILC
jgi:hypothetical protein